MIQYRELITRRMVQAEPDTLFVFGDNLLRIGYGGQAKVMRDEPNAVGIVTKLKPSMSTDAFFNNSACHLLIWRAANQVAFTHLLQYPDLIVWPRDGIGTGRAQLPTRAPKIWQELEEFRVSLESGWI
jgi:hypothetical protein